MNIVKIYNKCKNVKLVKIVKDKKRIYDLKNICNSKVIKTEFGKYIEEFATRLVYSDTGFNLTLFKKNLRTLKVVVVPKIESGIMGTYNAMENTIYIDENYIDILDEIIYHELFHMASTKVNGENCSIGFFNGTLFTYFNEGYTEVLTKRYFGDKSKAYPYMIEMPIVQLFEFIIGQDLMERLYSECNYLDMLMEFSKYTKKQEDTYTTLNEIDKMSVAYENGDYKDAMTTCRKIVKVFVEAFIKKCSYGVSNEVIDEFFKLMPLSFSYEDVDYVIFTQEEVDEYKKNCYDVVVEKDINTKYKRKIYDKKGTN